jgi:hypothetical protein
MRMARVGVIAAAVLAVATMAFAQAKPDFSGTWTPDVPADAPAGGGGRGGMAVPMTVTQKGDTLTIERTIMDNKVTSSYKLDGTESAFKRMGRGGNEVEVKATAKWDGNKLVITEKAPGRGGEMQETTQTWSLDGGVLTVERTTGRGPMSTKYKKS